MALGAKPLAAVELLALAGAVGVTAEGRGDRLRLRGWRGAEPVMRLLLARKEEVIAALAGGGSPPPAPPGDRRSPSADAGAATALAEVLALVPRVNANWVRYIATRLEVDAGDAERLRRVRDWVLANAELARRSIRPRGAD